VKPEPQRRVVLGFLRHPSLPTLVVLWNLSGSPAANPTYRNAGSHAGSPRRWNARA